MPDIKTRDVVSGTIKAVDRSALAGQRMKDAYVQAKDKAEHSVYASESNSEEYASEQITNGASTVAREAVHQKGQRKIPSYSVRHPRCAVNCLLLFSEHLTPYDPYLQDLSIAKQPPDAEHLLGTDRYGRDMLSRVIVGSRTSIFSTLLLVAIITALGTAVGVVCGWNGKALDTVLMRISDLFLAFPGLVFALAVAGVLGGGLQNAIIALVAISWPKYARLARSQTLAQKETAWMKAAKLSGSSTVKLILKHILPNIIGPILVTSMLDIGTMMMELAALSFLGLGAKPPIAEWGSMMSDTRSLMTTSPWITFSPGIAIFLSVMIFNLLGDTIRDYADPKSRGR